MTRIPGDGLPYDYSRERWDGDDERPFVYQRPFPPAEPVPADEPEAAA